MQTKGISIETWQQHYEELHSEYKTDMSGSITDEEVEAKLKKLKNRKSLMPKGISNELPKYEGPKLSRKLSQLLNRILNETEAPD